MACRCWWLSKMTIVLYRDVIAAGIRFSACMSRWRPPCSSRSGSASSTSTLSWSSAASQIPWTCAGRAAWVELLLLTLRVRLRYAWRGRPLHAHESCVRSTCCLRSSTRSRS